MCLSFLITSTGTVRWRAEGAALGSQSELSPELMSPPRTHGAEGAAALGSQSEPTLHIPGIIYRYRYTLLRLHIGLYTPVFGIFPMTADSIFLIF